MLLKEGIMAWIMLILAGIFEVVWAYSMKLSDGFSKLTPSIITLFFMILSFALLAYAMRSLPLGTAYTIWTGIGAVGSFLVGIFILGEPASAMRMLAAVLIVSGLLLMKISSS
jgi:quaternary ammonium compound-resistance protein SugE